MRKKSKKKIEGGGPVTHKGIKAIGALQESVGFTSSGDSWINPRKDELMYNAGFRTIEQMKQEGLL